MSRLLPFALVFCLGCGGTGSAPAAKSPAAGAEQAVKGEKPDAPGERKLIFRAFLDVVVHDMDAAVAQAEKAVADRKGYVAKSEMRGNARGRGYVTFTIRVPADQLRPLLADLKALGTAERDALESDDVTEEYRDVQTQIKNMKAEEETLLRLMKEKAASVEDVLKVRAQVQPLRERIERAEGRFEYLSKMTELSTVTLTLREIKDYKPAPTTFGSRAGRTLSDSTDGLVQFFENAALAVVSVVPWLPLILPAAVVGWLLLRRWRRRMAARRAV